MPPAAETRRGPALSVEPDARRFTSGQAGALLQHLQESESSSLFYPITADREVLFDADGRTVAGQSRFTHWAFFQLCQAVSPGLHRLVMDLSGMNRSAEAPRSDYSFSDAVAVLNLMIRRRFSSKLYGHHLLRDRRTNVIHGVVGSNYRWLPNKDLYDRTNTIVRASRRPMQFHEAVLNGRWLMLRFRQTDPFFSVPGPESEDPFYSGFHFSNNEVGLASVRAAAILLRGQDWTASMTPVVRLVHSSGRGFEQKLEMILAGVAERLRDPMFYQQNVLSRLLPVLLGLGRDSAGAWRDERSERRRRDDLAHSLTRKKISGSLARRIISSVVAIGSYDGPRAEMTRTMRSTWATRTVYDLYNAIGREARRLSIGWQEKAEQLAYALLTGRLAID